MTCAWKNIKDKNLALTFSDGYIDFLNKCKTERTCIEFVKSSAEANGFKDIDAISSLKAGDKVYKVNRGKNIILARIGKEDIVNGTNIIASHIDSPRLDLKQHPLYEDSGLALFKTHYYGGLKKYQWTAIPLSLIGVVIDAEGNTINVNLGEDEGDPVLTITDLLPHLASDQMSKKMTEAFTGEDLNVLVGSMPHDDEEKTVKDAILDTIKEKYGFDEDDFISAELEIVPSFKAVSVGLDSSMVGSYGQDDRVCAYTSLMGIIDCADTNRTAICYLADKEEIGSVGNTGMMSRFFENFVAEIIEKSKGEYNDMYLRRALSASMCISADVAVALDPNYKSVSEEKNSAFIGGGLTMCKYTGARGKYSTSDANAEFVGKIRRMFDDAGIAWQTAELGKVDQGGGGTVAQFIANLDVDTIDVGVALLSMHAPFEIASKADVYTAYLGYKAFYEA
ncbi:MAG: aminopeptidase [Clostridia bacterium]|nr:aminopeptidase [Clostridia bacterium]